MKSNITIGCNLLTSIDSLAYPNHCQFWYNVGKNLSHKYLFPFSAQMRMSIDNMRNWTAKFALFHNSEFIFFYDDDVLLPANALEILLGHMETDENIAIAAGLVYVRGYPFPPMVYERTKEGGLTNDFDFIKEAGDSGVLDCGAVGFSCALLRMSFLKNMSVPYFITASHCTEDIYYCVRLRENYPDVRIICDTNIKCGHIVGKYAVDRDGLDVIRKFEEEHFREKPIKNDRGDDYAEQVLERVGAQE